MKLAFAIFLLSLLNCFAVNKVVQTDINNIVAQPPSFWATQPSDAAFSNAVNAVAGGGSSVITNGLATTNWVAKYFYPTSNPSLFISSVPLSATNWLADSNTLINMAGGAVAGSNYLKTIPVAATNQFLVTVPTSATNWLVDTNTSILWAGKAIGGSNYLTTVPIAATNQFLVTVPIGATNWIQNSNNLIAMAGGAISGSNYLITVPVAATNQFLVTVPIGATNWIVDTNTAILWAGKAVSGSNYLLTVPTAATNHFIESTVTNNLVYQNNLATNVTHYIGNGITAYFYGTNAGGAELTVTNSNSAGWSGVTAQADNGSFVTNYFGLYVNNSLFVPGSTYVGSTNDGVLEMAGRNMIFDVIGNAAHWYWLTRPATNGAMTTNFDFTSSAANFLLPLQINGNPVITNAYYTNKTTITTSGNWLVLGTNNLAGGGGGSTTYNGVTNSFGSFSANIATNYTMLGSTINFVNCVTNANQVVYITNQTPHGLQVYYYSATIGTFTVTTNLFSIVYPTSFPSQPCPTWSTMSVSNILNTGNIFRLGFTSNSVSGFTFGSALATVPSANSGYLFSFQVSY